MFYLLFVWCVCVVFFFLGLDMDFDMGIRYGRGILEREMDGWIG